MTVIMAMNYKGSQTDVFERVNFPGFYLSSNYDNES